jgi:hypothetical protein
MSALELYVTLLSLAVGMAGGCLSFRLPASGKAAFVLALSPLLGVWLASKFC